MKMNNQLQMDGLKIVSIIMLCYFCFIFIAYFSSIGFFYHCSTCWVTINSLSMFVCRTEFTYCTTRGCSMFCTQWWNRSSFRESKKTLSFTGNDKSIGCLSTVFRQNNFFQMVARQATNFAFFKLSRVSQIKKNYCPTLNWISIKRAAIYRLFFPIILKIWLVIWWVYPFIISSDVLVYISTVCITLKFSGK